MSIPLALGLDLGTGGARAAVVRADGELVATGRAPLDAGRAVQRPGRHEQNPDDWWRASRSAIGQALERISAAESRAIEALCVDGTSGTVVGVDARGAVTTPALMYNDARAGAEASELDELALDAAGVRPGIAASWSLAKVRWLERHAPAEFEATHRFVHQADLIAARLTGRFGVSDYSNALKCGYDVQHDRWPAWLDGLAGVRPRLPDVVAPGEILGSVRGDIADALGLPRRVRVVAGVTDGTAAFLASGASRPGDDNTTLGTTLVFKRVAAAHVRDAGGLLYCHRLPGGVWLPGAASNVGGEWIRKQFAGADLEDLDRAAERQLPVERLAYPLCTRGERFPFRAEAVGGFDEAPVDDRVLDYAAKLQGTAFVERLAYDVLDRSAGGGGDVFATGGGAASDVWLQLRADVTGRVLHRPEHPDSAFGSAVLALAGGLERDLWETSRAMVRVTETFAPRPERHARYTDYHRRFVALLEQHGHLSPGPN